MTLSYYPSSPVRLVHAGLHVHAEHELVVVRRDVQEALLGHVPRTRQSVALLVGFFNFDVSWSMMKTRHQLTCEDPCVFDKWVFKQVVSIACLNS